MLDFQSTGKRRATNYLARSEQRRLLVLVLLLGGVLLLMFEVAKPKNWAFWEFLTGADQRPPVQAPAELAEGPPPPTAAQADAPAAAPEASETDQLARLDTPSPLAGDDPTRPRVEPPRHVRPPRPAIDDPLAAVNADLLADVENDTFLMVRNRELPALFHLLDILDATPQETLVQASDGRISYIQLISQPTAYRGRLVTLDGWVHRAQRLTAPKNDLHIEDYYQLWLQPIDKAEPVTLLSLELPVGFPLGDGLFERVSVTGFVFKRWVFVTATQDPATAPLLLTKTVQWTPSAVAGQEQPGWQWPGPGRLNASYTTMALLALLAIAWFVIRRQLSFNRKPFKLIDRRDALLETPSEPPLSDEEIGRRLTELAHQEETAAAAGADTAGQPE